MIPSVVFFLASAFAISHVVSVSVPLDRASEACTWNYADTSAWNTDCVPGCNGTKQSPIDIDTGSADDSKSWQLTFGDNYMNTLKGKWQRKGYTIQFTVDDWNVFDTADDGNFVSYDKSTDDIDLTEQYFRLWQFHFHWGADDTEGSEHTLDGDSYPLEVHFVHVNEEYANNLTAALSNDDGLLVIGFFFETSAKFGDDFALARRFSPVRKAAEYINKNEKATNGNVELPSSFRHVNWFDATNVATDHWHYEGGLTTPTCNEVVTWIVSKDRLKVTPRDLAELRNMENPVGSKILKNYRDPQDMNGRTLYSL